MGRQTAAEQQLIAHRRAIDNLEERRVQIENIIERLQRIHAETGELLTACRSTQATVRRHSSGRSMHAARE